MPTPRFFPALLAAACAGSFAGGADVSHAPTANPVTPLMDALLEAMHQRSPESVGPAIGDDRYNDRLGDISEPATQAWLAENRRLRTLAERIDPSSLDEDARIDLDLLLFAIDTTLEGAPFKRWQIPVSTMDGPQLWLPQLGTQVPFTKPRHDDDYLARLKQVPRVLQQTMANMRAGLAEGRVPPRVTIEPTVASFQAMASDQIRQNPTSSPFFSPLLRLEENDPRRAEAARIIAEEITPAYAVFADFLLQEYLPKTRQSTSISESIDGPALYDLLIREHTTLPLSAEEVHATGLAEVARIRAEMMETIARSDFPRKGEFAGDPDALFAAFTAYLRTDPRFYYQTSEELFNSYKVISKTIDLHMPELFGLLPRLPYGLVPTPRFMAASSPSAYYVPGSLKSGVPGRFMTNLSALDQRPKYEMIALTMHEAVPGHHHQIALAQELDHLHPLRRMFQHTAYIEGWALYSERLGLEMGGSPDDPAEGQRGMYADPYDDFGRLNMEMWRALRLVVDTGLHAKGWTRQQAVDYMLANSASSRVNIENEVTRYIAMPGQALAYKIGEIKIRELRREAEEALGVNFDLRAFHDALLDAGSLPLPVLEAKIQRWIEQSRQTISTDPRS